jgi:hypothetical protein
MRRMQAPPRSPTPFAYTSVMADNISSLGYSRNLVLVTFRERALTERIARMHELARQVHASIGQPLGIFVRVLKHCVTPSGESKNRIQEFMADSGQTTAGWVVVLESEGFWGAAARAMTSSVLTLSNSGLNHKVLGRVDQGAVWLADALQKARAGNPPPTAEEIASLVERMP